ncbi:MAG: hypothetical protein HKM01_09015 [Gallionella sp.]|nr:hypothetical protein [Gallionella sp.]
MLKPNKDATIKAAISLTPVYTKLFRELQKNGGRIIFLPEIAARQNLFGFYVIMYDNELKFSAALSLALLGEDQFHKLNAELKDASKEDQQQFLDAIVEQGNWDEILKSFQIPNSPQEWEAAQKQLELLPSEERQALEKRGGFFWSYYFGSFFNTLALMVHGEKLTTLVPQAINGDDDAFLKAAQTDRMLLIHHPYFRERKFRAQNEGDKKFLFRLANHESIPVLVGKIQFPGLYMLFGLLESFQWLDNLGATEILDICVQANLDRYQNRIDDECYVSKRLREYRQWQKTLRMSRI